MTLHTFFKKPGELCSAVQDIAKDHFDHLARLPYNRFDPDASTWWLVPANENPAYKYTKYYFNWADDSRRAMRVGVHAEKGLLPSVSSVYLSARGSTLIMHRDWRWYSFISGIEDGTLPQALADVARQMPVPFELRVVAGYVQDPTEFDPYSLLGKWDQFIFEHDAAPGDFVLRSSKTEYQILSGLSKRMTFAELASAFKLFSENAWLWINVYLTVEFQSDGGSGTAQETVWTEADIWTNYLRHFRFAVSPTG